MSNTIAESLVALHSAKTAISTAITTAGGIVNAGDGFSDFASAIASVPKQHYATGFKDMDGNTAMFEITGIKDSNGEPFTPRGFAFVGYAITTGTQYAQNWTGSNTSANCCAFIYNGEEMSRIIAHTPAYTARLNNFETDNYISVGQNSDGGYFSLNQDSKAYYPHSGRFMWVCWG